MIQVLRVRVMAAFLAALLLTAVAATPIVTNIASFGGTAQAEDCSNTSC